MSHFSVMVRLAAKVKRADFDSVVGDLMAPYCEHDNDGKSEKFFKFIDTEDESRKKYETESTTFVRVEDGSLVLPWDKRFKKDGDLFANPEAPKDLPRVEVPHRQCYATFEEFMDDWCGEERDEEHKRYGHRANPNAKWDYWRIGGRWRGDLLVKPVAQDAGLAEKAWEFDEEFRKGRPVPGGVTEVDFCRIADIDGERVAAEAKKRAEEFWTQLDQWFSGREFDEWTGPSPRPAMLALGLLDCHDTKELPEIAAKAGGEIYWSKKWDRGRERWDVIARKPDRAALEAVVLRYMNPIRPWAFLDGDGWRERGRMGWFGMGGDTAESNDVFCKGFEEWIKGGDQRDWIVVVDCHI